MGSSVSDIVDLYEEARNLLAVSGVESLLSQYGEVALEGSYVYRTMVDRDIDFTVTLSGGKDLSYELRSDVASRLMLIPALRGLKMSDPHHFPAGSMHDIDGFWFGLTLVSPLTHERWNIDAWFIRPGGNAERDEALIQQLTNLTDKDRKTIVALKQSALDAGQKQKGLTSVEIYWAVLDRGISTYEDFIASK